MQTQNPLLDEIAKLSTAAMGLAQAAGEEAKAALRSQTDGWSPSWTWCGVMTWTR